jgi:hypothetical protein
MKDFDRNFTQNLRIVNLRKISTINLTDRKPTKDFNRDFTQYLRIVNLRKISTVILHNTYES